MSDKKKILLVDKDLEIITDMARYLGADHEDYEVKIAGNGKEALEILDSCKISLVVTDIDMPAGDGTYFFEQIKDLDSETELILMADYAMDTLDKAAYGGSLYFLEKPVDFEHVRKLIKDFINIKEDGFAGTLKNIDLTDLLQMCCLSCSSMTILVKKGSDHGMIYIKDGQIIHAKYRSITGEDAFFDILSWGRGSFETLDFIPVSKETIKQHYQYLLMEAAKRIDESFEEEDISETKHLETDLSDSGKIRVLIVDDSAMMRRILTDVFSYNQQIVVVGTAKNGEEALEQIDLLRPDLITLDVNMPVMCGDTALKHIMIKSPSPVVIISSVGDRSKSKILNFLRLGAVDFISKPSWNESLTSQKNRINKKILLAAQARMESFTRVKEPKTFSRTKNTDTILSLASTLTVILSGPGGYTSLIKTLPHLSEKTMGSILVIQDMPEEFMETFAEYLDKRSRVPVLPIKPETEFYSGHCFIATPGILKKSTLKAKSPDGATGVLWEKDLNGKLTVDEITDRFLSASANFFADRILVILFSGAFIKGLTGLKNISSKKGSIIAEHLSSIMVQEPIINLMDAQLIQKELNCSEIAEAIGIL